MDIGVLGPLQVFHGGRDVMPGGRLQRAVFVRLLLDANHVVSVDRLVEDVFEEKQPQNPNAAIHIHVSRLRKALAGVEEENSELIASAPPGYRLRLGPRDVDAWRFEQLVADADAALTRSEPGTVAEKLAAALALWRGPALSDFAYVPWAQANIARLEGLRLNAVEDLFEARLALGDHHETVPELRALADEHPLRERLWGLLMRALYLDGSQAEALRAYQQARRVLADKAGLAPCRELQELEQAILRQEPALHGTVSVAAPAGRPRRQAEGPQVGSVPPLARALTRFVGREQAKVEVGAMLATNRLVTLTGMAGIGKTRLALEVASDVMAAGGDVRLTELASLSEPGLVVGAVAAATGGRDERACSDLPTLARAIGQNRQLIVLDNCEHLLHACAELVVNLLGLCPNLRILATSQEVLDIPGEATWPVPPLSMPSRDAAISPDVLHTAEAAQLFCDRAVLVRPAFSLSNDNCEAVATICRRLDGIPLAIELAAAAVNVLSVWEIAALLDDRFNLLSTTSRWVSGRHQTLLAAVDWSHDLLSGPEQVLLRRLSIFAGGATLGAIEEVCAGGDLAVSEILAGVSGLVAKSLLMADTGGRQGRYRLLETVRAYAADRLLEAGEHATVAERHARWCVGLAERAEPELAAADQLVWHERLHADHDNARAALDWLLAERRGELALRLSGALTLFWSHEGYHREGREWLERALVVGAAASVPRRATGLWGIGQMCVMGGDLRAAAVVAAESLELWRSCGSFGGQARALLVLGHSGESHAGMTAMQALEESARLAREAGDLGCLSESLNVSGWVHLNRGELSLARPLFTEAIGVARPAQDGLALFPGLLGLGYVALHSGDYPLAENTLGEALALSRRQKSFLEMSMALNLLAELVMGCGDDDSARPLLDEALGLARRIDLSHATATILCNMGRLELGEGDTAKAQACFEQARAVDQKRGFTSSPSLLGLAEVHRTTGELAAAKVLLGNAFAQARGKGNVLGLADVVSALGDLALAEGELDEATSRHQWALRQRARVGDLPAAVQSLESLASIAVLRDEPHRAARLFGFTETVRTSRGFGRPPTQRCRHDAVLARLRGRLGAGELEAAGAEGATRSLADAVAGALCEAVEA